MKLAVDTPPRLRPLGSIRGGLRGVVRNVLRGGGAMVLLGWLAGCTSTLSELPAAVGGLPTDAPERSAAPAAFPAVHDMPAARTNTVLTEDQQKKAAADLAAARDRQAKQAATATKDP